MLIAVALLFPILLLLLTLGMERVERPLDTHDTRLELERFLDAAELDVRPDEVETFVAEGYAKALDRYWGRRRRALRRVTAGASRVMTARPVVPGRRRAGEQASTEAGPEAGRRAG